MKRCVRCVMDDASDNYITFNEKGECNYCTNAISRLANTYFPNSEGQSKLDSLLKEIKKHGQNRKYDCVIGLSGGIDSSYLAYLCYKWNLRALAIHIDDGYDTEISKANIKRLINATNFDYEVIRPNAEQFNDLTLSFMKAGVPNIAIPQDNVLFAFLYSKMKQYKIKYFLSGGNFATESILQSGNTHNAFDVRHIKSIHKIFGSKSINDLKLISTFQKGMDGTLLGIKSPRPLNYINYNKDMAFNELNAFCDFEYYDGKHLENIFTAFAQLYWFPKKFNVDKRKSHYSSLIISNQMTREEALRKLQENLYDEKMMDYYINIITNHLGISMVEFNQIINSPIHNHNDYVTEDKTLLFRIIKFLHNSFCNRY